MSESYYLVGLDTLSSFDLHWYYPLFEEFINRKLTVEFTLTEIIDVEKDILINTFYNRDRVRGYVYHYRNKQRHIKEKWRRDNINEIYEFNQIYIESRDEFRENICNLIPSLFYEEHWDKIRSDINKRIDNICDLGNYIIFLTGDEAIDLDCTMGDTLDDKGFLF